VCRRKFNRRKPLKTKDLQKTILIFRRRQSIATVFLAAKVTAFRKAGESQHL